jgi:polar amino acid transport system substrate-binding protein
MKQMTKLGALLFALMIVAAACGGGATDAATVSEGKLTICSEVPYEPFEMEDGSGGYTGFDIELADAVAGELGLDLEVKNTAFDGILLEVASGGCDMVASAMTITAERAENSSFSDPYFNAGQSLLVLAESGSPKLGDMGGKTIGVQSNTTGEAYAQDNAPSDATIKSFESGEDLFLALTSKDVDAILQDLPVNGFRAQNDPNFTLSDTFVTDEEYGFGMKKDSDLVAEVNKALSTLRDNGTYGDLHEKYFGTRG